jgi:hypothetical protein
MIDALIEQSRNDGSWRAVLKARGMQAVDDGLFFVA